MQPALISMNYADKQLGAGWRWHRERHARMHLGGNRLAPVFRPKNARPRHADWTSSRRILDHDPALMAGAGIRCYALFGDLSGDTIRPMQSAVAALQEYYTAFSSLDLNAIVPHFCEPCMSIGPQGVFSAGRRTDLANAFAPFIERLRAKGYGRSEFTDPQVTMLSETAALVQGVAVRYLADGPEMERVRISYLMYLTDTGWKIAVMVLPS